MKLTLTDRELEFLHESNKIEDIENIDYRKPENAIPGAGHVGAFLDAMNLAKDVAITVADICRWQSMITGEQLRFGVEIATAGIGKIRSPELPINVKVGSSKTPSFLRVPEMLDDLIREMRVDTAVATKSDALEIGAAAVGDYLCEFEWIHPFIDGNGRTGRILANLVGMRHGLPLLVFKSSDRQKFFESHGQRHLMRAYIYELAKTTLKEQ